MYPREDIHDRALWLEHIHILLEILMSCVSVCKYLPNPFIKLTCLVQAQFTGFFFSLLFWCVQRVSLAHCSLEIEFTRYCPKVVNFVNDAMSASTKVPIPKNKYQYILTLDFVLPRKENIRLCTLFLNYCRC
jgi:hypothetical protein